MFSGSIEQAASIEELSAIILDIKAEIEKTTNNSNVANDYAIDMKQGIEASNGHMTELVKAMEDMSVTSGEIEKIIKTISDIAFQTNILALNAVVEAARAGSAVVADEVRNLASKSSEAVKNTSFLIENTISSIKNGTEIANSTYESLNQVVNKVSLTSEKVIEIASATHKQMESISIISNGIEQISNVVQNNSATAEESVAASEELSSQSSLLNDLVGNFKLM